MSVLLIKNQQNYGFNGLLIALVYDSTAEAYSLRLKAEFP